MIKKLYIGSIIAFVLNATLHLLAWTNLSIPQSDSLLHFLFFCSVFVFGGLAIYHGSRHPRVVEYELENPPDEGMSLEPFFKDAPFFINALSILCIILIALSFGSKSQPYDTSIDFINGKYLLKNDIGIIKTITQIEYNKYQNESIKIFSAGSMLFLSISILVFNRLTVWEKDSISQKTN